MKRLPAKLSPLLFLLALLLFCSISCGKKGPPTLKAYQKPLPPTLLEAIHRENRIILRWDFPKKREFGISGFLIKRSTGQGFAKISDSDNNSRSYEDYDVKEGATLSYKIISRNYRGIYSNDSNTITITPSNVPLPVKNISFTIEGDSILLSWVGLGDDILYNVYRSHEKGKYGLIPVNRSPLKENSFKDPFNFDGPVYYTVRSLTASVARDEGPAAEVALNPLELVPSPPRELQHFVSAGKVYLFWKEPEENWITGYRVYRRTDSGDYVLIGETVTPAFIDKENDILAKRDYRVTSAGPRKESVPAEIKHVIIPVKE